MEKYIEDLSMNDAMKEIAKRLSAARRTAQKAQEAADSLFWGLEDLGITPEKYPTSSETADNLKEAILGYISDLNYCHRSLMNEIESAYKQSHDKKK